jgi:hypothetical protein
MREAVWSSIRQVWPQCILEPDIAAQDVTVEIYEDGEQHIQWRLHHESSYEQYVKSLLPMSQILKEEKQQDHEYVDYSSLIWVRHLGGRGNTVVVRKSSGSEDLYVFKGLDFLAFLGENYYDFFKDSYYHEIRTLYSLPKHPNIKKPPSIFVTTGKTEDTGEPLICGTLCPFMKNGTIDERVRKSNEIGTRLKLTEKALWCFQMASAIHHTHFTAQNFHMDVKPTNVLVDDNRDIILIDWEQSGAPLCTLAPEANGFFDVEEVPIPGSKESRLVYKKYEGPPRENNDAQPKWNVFPIWRYTCPRALEAAEVFSLGRTMWMLLAQVPEHEVEDLEAFEIWWSEESSDIPEDWKPVMRKCLVSDANERMRLSDLMSFWAKARSEP